MESTGEELDSSFRREWCGRLQDIDDTPGSGYTDEEHVSSIEGKFIGELNLSDTRFQVRSDWKSRTAAHVGTACQFT